MLEVASPVAGGTEVDSAVAGGTEEGLTGEDIAAITVAGVAALTTEPTMAGMGFGPSWYPYSYPYYYPYSYPNAYPYSYPYPSYPNTDAQPPVYSEPDQFYWYYCQDPQGYYPYVKSCPGGWTRVVPTPPQP